MINGINVSGLSEYMHEVRSCPEEGKASYGVKLQWESGTKSRIETKTMVMGRHRVIRNFHMGIDEPRQLLGINSAPNPAEYLFAGLAGCMSVVFLAGASILGIHLESLEIEINGALDLHGFLEGDDESGAGFPEIHYTVKVRGNGTPEQYASLMQRIERHSPNYATLARPVRLVPHLKIEESLTNETPNLG